MNLLIIFGLCAAVVWVISYLRAYRAIKKLGHHPPAYKSFLPLGLDFLWKFTRSLQNHKDLEFWQNMFLDNGNSANPYTIEVYILGKKIMFTADPENMKAILATQFNDFGKGERFREDWRPFLGASIFTADGQLWHDLRQLVRVQFLKDRVSDLRVFEHHTQILLSKLEGGDKGVNVTDLFLRFTIDAATHFLLGHSIDTLTNPHVKFAEAFAEVQRIQTVLSRMGPFKRFVPKSEYNAHLKVINEFVNPFVEEALSLSPEELEKKTKSDEGYTFLHALAAYSRDRALLRDQIVSVLIAGRDTTASTLSWCIHELSKQPRIVSKLRKEIEDVVGFEKAPTYADLKSMRYLQVSISLNFYLMKQDGTASYIRRIQIQIWPNIAIIPGIALLQIFLADDQYSTP